MHTHSHSIRIPKVTTGRAAAVFAALAAAAGLAVAAPAGAAPGVTARIEQHTLRVTGTAGNDHIVVKDGTSNTVDVDKDGDGDADFNFNRAHFNKVVLNGGNGNDELVALGDFSIEEATWILGSNGSDRLTGANGAERFDGGSSNDWVLGGRGNDDAVLGSGNDRFVWNPGDGSDSIEGDSGVDLLQFNGAGVDEKIDVEANGSRLRFLRDVASINMDANNLETVRFNALGGVDTINVDDLSATDVTSVRLDLGAALGGTGGDGQADRIAVNGSNGNDHIGVAGDAAEIRVTGLGATTTLVDHEATDLLTVYGQQGNDTIDASTLGAGFISTAFSGGWGNDTLLGSANAEVLNGGRDNDQIDGNVGNDVGLMSDGTDTFTWDPGDGSDVVEGGEGRDTLNFNGASAAEVIDISANGNRGRFFRNLGNIVMDTDDTEVMRFNGNGGADTVTVNDLSSTDIVDVDINLPKP